MGKRLIAPMMPEGDFVLDGKGWRRDTRNGGEFVPLLTTRGHWIADIRENGGVHTFLAGSKKMAAALEQIIAYADSSTDPAIEAVARTALLSAGYEEESND